MRYYDTEDFNQTKREFDINYLKRRVESALADIETIKQYVAECIERAQEIVFMDIKRHVSISREKNRWENKVYYYVSIRNDYYINGEYQDHYSTEENKKFSGNERIVAIAYAKELKKKYNCPVTKHNIPDTIKFDV